MLTIGNAISVFFRKSLRDWNLGMLTIGNMMLTRINMHEGSPGAAKPPARTSRLAPAGWGPLPRPQFRGRRWHRHPACGDPLADYCAVPTIGDWRLASLVQLDLPLTLRRRSNTMPSVGRA